MFFLVIMKCGSECKKPASLLAGGLWCFLISLADLPQAIAVRRHGMSMVVVIAVMVAELHLLSTLSGNITGCQHIKCDLRAARFRSRSYVLWLMKLEGPI
jgi:hypothetical protein